VDIFWHTVYDKNNTSSLQYQQLDSVTSSCILVGIPTKFNKQTSSA